MGHVFFTAAGLFVEIILIWYFFDEISSFIRNVQLIVYPPFPFDVKVFATVGLCLTITFFMYLQRYLLPRRVGSSWQRIVLAIALVYYVVFVPIMMFLEPSIAIFNNSALLSSLLVLGFSLLEIYLAPPR